MPKWTKKSAIERTKINKLLQEVVSIEPRIQKVIDEAVQQQDEAGYHRIRTYYALKQRIELLVGWHATKPELRAKEYYDVVIRVIDDLLPPDVSLLFVKFQHFTLVPR